MPEPDYAALAKQLGGTYVPPPTATPTTSGQTTPPSEPDYSAIAKQFGGTYVPPAVSKSKPTATDETPRIACPNPSSNGVSSGDVTSSFKPVPKSLTSSKKDIYLLAKRVFLAI